MRPKEDGRLAEDRSGEVLYGLIDFELLRERPPGRNGYGRKNAGSISSARRAGLNPARNFPRPGTRQYHGGRLRLRSGRKHRRRVVGRRTRSRSVRVLSPREVAAYAPNAPKLDLRGVRDDHPRQRPPSYGESRVSAGFRTPIPSSAARNASSTTGTTAPLKSSPSPSNSGARESKPRTRAPSI